MLCCSPGLSLSVSSVWVTGQFNHSVSVGFSLCVSVSFLSLQSHLLFKGYCMKRRGLLKMYHRQNTRHSMVCPNQIGSGFQRVYHVIIFSEKHTGHNNPCYQAYCECTVAISLHLHFDNHLKIGKTLSCPCFDCLSFFNFADASMSLFLLLISHAAQGIRHAWWSLSSEHFSLSQRICLLQSSLKELIQLTDPFVRLAKLD